MPKKENIRKLKRIIFNTFYAQLLLLFLWLVVQLILFKVTGVKIANDSPRYIFHATRLTDTGIIPGGQNFWYAGYIGLLTLFMALNTGYTALIAFQVLLTGFAVVALYSATLKITKGNLVAAFFATAFYVLWPKIHLWNFYILTDSTFSSMMVISFWALVHLRNWKGGIAVLPLFLYSFLIRPNGIGFLVAAVVFIYFLALRHNRMLTLKVRVWLFPLVIALTLLVLNKMLTSFHLIETYARGEVIYLFKGVLVEGRNRLNLPASNRLPLFKVFSFIIYNPIFFIKLSGLKLSFFILNVRPYYSVFHNAFLLLLLPIYYLAVRGVISKTISLSAKAFILAFIGFQAFIVMLTVEDWDGRFLVPVLPFVFILAGVGLSKFVKGKTCELAFFEKGLK